jgi:hypothetical protein
MADLFLMKMPAPRAPTQCAVDERHRPAPAIDWHAATAASGAPKYVTREGVTQRAGATRILEQIAEIEILRLGSEGTTRLSATD